MKIKRIASAAVVLLGIAGAILRGLSFTFGYDPRVELFYSNPFSLVLWIMSALVAAALAAYYFAGPQTRWESVTARSSAGTVFMMAAAVFVIASGGVLTIVSLLNFSFGGVANGMLAVVSALAMVGLSRVIPGRINEASQTLTTVPVFWACLWMLLEYRGESSNPERELYVYRIVAIIFVILLFYNIAFCFIRNGRVNRLFASALGCAYFSIVAVFGDMPQFFATAVLSGRYDRLQSYVCLLGMLCLAAGMILFLANTVERLPADFFDEEDSVGQTDPADGEKV